MTTTRPRLKSLYTQSTVEPAYLLFFYSPLGLSYCQEGEIKRLYEPTASDTKFFFSLYLLGRKYMFEDELVYKYGGKSLYA
jgi:hypothetical protein